MSWCEWDIYALHTYIGANVKGGDLLLNGFQFPYLFTNFYLDVTKTRV